MVDLERKVQDRAIEVFVNDLGYKKLGNLKEKFNENIKQDLLERNLKKRGYCESLIRKAIFEINKLAKQTKSLYKNNKDIYSLIRYGAKVKQDNGDKPKTVSYIDFKNIENNDFYIAEEVSVEKNFQDAEKSKRPDLVIYINGIAVVVIELKRSSVGVADAIRQNLGYQKEENIGWFFNTAQLLLAGNESEGLRYGAIETPEKFYLQWRESSEATDLISLKVKDLIAQNSNRLREDLISLCQKDRLLSIIYDFIIFDKGHKKIARHNQYFANIAARQRINSGEGGIIWNTQGSGKSLIMVWLAKWIIENVDDGRVVIITDRTELDDQIESLFKSVDENITRAKSGEDLKKILSEKGDPIVCSLIHKYGSSYNGEDSDPYESLANFEAQGNIIAFIDECHRTNSGVLHQAVRKHMPNAIIIGFTGTPLLKANKATSIETFGGYIHTYKFNEGIKDGVILGLTYEARNVEQYLNDAQNNIDKWFEDKAQHLTKSAQTKLKNKLASANKLYSTRPRLKQIAADIYFDIQEKPRLIGEGTAMLVAKSIYDACRYWEEFQKLGLTQCAVVTSYDPNSDSLRNATSDLNELSEDEYKNKVYKEMLAGRSVQDFEAEAKRQFKEEPHKMKLLIVVDKLLTGFDAPSASYIYIDKKMKDHGLFQAICRVNRPDDGIDKPYGRIIDYMLLFDNIESAVNDYTGGAFDKFDKEDIEGLIKSRSDEAKARMIDSLRKIDELLSHVDGSKDEDYINYFTSRNAETTKLRARRKKFYSLVSKLTLAFPDCYDKLESVYNYSSQDVQKLKNKIIEYNKLKDMIKLAGNDSDDLKAYDAEMRSVLDTYVCAKPAKSLGRIDGSLIELLAAKKLMSVEFLFIDRLTDNPEARAEIVANNINQEIIKKLDDDPQYYENLRDQLNDLVRQLKEKSLSYQDYLNRCAKLAQLILSPESSTLYPEEIRVDKEKKQLYNLFNSDSDSSQVEQNTISIDQAICSAAGDSWKNSQQKQNEVKKAIYHELKKIYIDSSDSQIDKKVEDIFHIAMKQGNYEK